MTCQFPHLKRSSAYRNGCRCDECRRHKSATTKPRKYPCPRCGGEKGRLSPACRACWLESFGPIVDRVVQRVRIDEAGCWIYEGCLNNSGYGMIRSQGRAGRQMLTHRVTYEHFVGPIPAGLQVDHLCRVKRCCNPDHLEAVTRSENALRHYRWVRESREATAP